MPNKRKLFIGCSDEASHIAFQVKSAINSKFKNTIEAKVFKETEWKNLTSILSNLTNRLDEFYYAVFIGYPDDVIFSRKSFYYTCRDNVLFEMGMFLTRLGSERTFFVIPKLDYKGSIPIQLDVLGVGKNIDFKLLSDFGKSLIINSRINLEYRKIKRKNKDTGKHEFIDKWIATNINFDLKSLLSEISQEEEKHIKISKAKIKELELASKAKKIIEEIKQHCLSGKANDEFYINKLLNELPSLIYDRSKVSNKSVGDTTVDIIELVYKFKDFLDIEQLARRQNYKEVKRVWVFADTPFEFDSQTKKQELSLMRKTILENIKKGVQYTYIVNQKFHVPDIDCLFVKCTKRDKEKYKKCISVVKIDSKHFKTFFTLHFPHRDSQMPENIYMSALLPDRQDLLIQISEDIHSKRVFERINKLIGNHHIDSNYSVKEYVVQD